MTPEYGTDMSRNVGMELQLYAAYYPTNNNNNNNKTQVIEVTSLTLTILIK